MGVEWTLVALSIVLFKSYYSDAQLLSNYHQNDYDLKMEKMIVVWYNHSMFKDFKGEFVPFNRTQRAFNYSSFQLIDFTRDIKITVQVYKFMSNEYRFFPITVTANVCDEIDRNSFNARSIMKKVSNIPACPWKKGFYYIANAVPDISRWPPYIPRGSYKVETKWYHQSYLGVTMDYFGTIIDKPVKWGN